MPPMVLGAKWTERYGQELLDFCVRNLTFGKGFAKNSHLKPLGFLSRLFYMITVINGDGNADLSPHAEPNELGLVEGLGDLPGEDGVHCADHHEEDWVAEGN